MEVRNSGSTRGTSTKKNIESNFAKHAKITTISNLKVIYTCCDSLSNKVEDR